MRLGILDCDRLDPDLVGDFGPVYSEMFIKGFRALAPKLEFRVWPTSSWRGSASATR